MLTFCNNVLKLQMSTNRSEVASSLSPFPSCLYSQCCSVLEVPVSKFLHVSISQAGENTLHHMLLCVCGQGGTEMN